MKQIFALGIILLFILSAMSSLGIGYDKTVEQEVSVSSGPMNSPWPMKCHDNKHSGRSSYDTSHINGDEKWRFACDWMESGIAIDDEGILYFGDIGRWFYAIYPNGTLKWKYKTGGRIWSTPAIGEDGTIYIGSWDHKLYAFNPDGSVKWKFNSGESSSSSPSIADDGTIYFGVHGSDRLFAVNSNGSEKWRYQTGGDIISDTAIGSDGTVYFGSLDYYIYAVYPNGTLRWRFKTGDEIHGNPSIAEDGTIYISSYDDYLYALYPNGSLKWKTDLGMGNANNPSIVSDGTIYVATDNLYAIRPDDGSIKWSFDFGQDRMAFLSSPAISADGTIYVGIIIDETNGGEIVAINHDGTEKWRKNIANYVVQSSPCIGEDGTVYIGSASSMQVEPWDSYGYIHAFGPTESNEPPQRPTITGTTKGKARVEYSYFFNSIDPNNNPVSFYIDWGDGQTQGWTREYASGEEVSIAHTYTEQGMYEISARARDTLGEESDWGTLNVRMPRYKTTSMLYWFLEEHPRLFPILRQLFDL